MEHRTAVYYTFCPGKEMIPKEYKKYQRKIADKMLAYGFETQFGTGFSLEHVKKGEHGKPFWAGKEEIYFNVSNTRGLVVCAVSDLEIGVDTELIRSVGNAVLERCCTEPEITYILGKYSEIQEEETKERFFQLWTLKESFIKMTGQGMYFPIKEAEFSIQKAGGIQEISSSQPGYFVQKRLREYWISLCMQIKSEVDWKELILGEL